MMRINIVSIFPDYFEALRLSLIGKAVTDGLLTIDAHDLRDWTHDRHRTVDDTPYGGGAGMVMKPEPWGEALDAMTASIRAARVQQPVPDRPVLVIPTPSGHSFTQQTAQELSACSDLVFACGRYEGIDHRVAEWAATDYEVREISLGDYVLNGGEVAAMAIIEAVARLVPGVIGNPDSLVEESHAAGTGHLLEAPVYTKPAVWRGLEVPEVLLSGHHTRIAGWRRQQSQHLTRVRRPDLLT